LRVSALKVGALSALYSLMCFSASGSSNCSQRYLWMRQLR
jgi:hypothetical protein